MQPLRAYPVRAWRRVVHALRRHPYRWSALVAVMLAAVVLWPRDPAPSFFTDAEIEHLNAGGVIASERFAAYDLVCLFGGNAFGYGDDNTCQKSNWPRLGVQKDGVCETYSLRGLKSTVLWEYNNRCRDVATGFVLRVWDGATFDFDGLSDR